MAEESAKPNWLRNIAGIFVEMPPEESATSSPSPASGTGFVGTASPQTQTTNITPQVATGDFVTELRNRFKKIIEDKNQPGFDFYEFSVMLLRSSSSPSGEQFKTAFEGAKMMNQGCDKSFLLSSAEFYKKELQVAYESTVQTGEQKKNTIGSEKAAEQKQLSIDLTNIDQQLVKLRSEIQALEQKRTEKDGALRSIDNKYNDKLAEIEGKIIATATAKDGVLTDILLIENGIKQFL
jgi:hypothetical protein